LTFYIIYNKNDKVLLKYSEEKKEGKTIIKKLQEKKSKKN